MPPDFLYFVITSHHLLVLCNPLDEDDAKELLSIINDSEWDNGCYKFRGEYRFIIDGKESTIEYYSEMGLFLDHTQDKQLFFTEQQKEYIHSVFKITDN